jgi:hypothetical protein
LPAKLAISQKIKLAEDMRYALSRRQGLTRLIDEVGIKLDNNTVERIARTRCFPDPTAVPNTGLSSRPWTRLAGRIAPPRRRLYC